MWKFGNKFPIIFDSSSDTLAGKKVKIGNDVRFKIQLSFGEETANILALEAFFVNVTRKESIEKEYGRINKFIRRFPIEPFKKEYEPTDYNINSCGIRSTYCAVPANMYNGFGVYPNWNKPDIDAMFASCIYKSEVERTSDPKVVIVTFPSEFQRFVGKYDLTIIAKIYDPAYKNNSRTVSATLPGMFELVDSQMEAIDNPVQIEIVNTDDTESLQDVYVIAGKYDNNSITVNRNDRGIVDIDISPITQWYEGD